MEIKRKRNQIEELYTQEIQKKLLYTKQKYYEGGSKYSKLLAYKLRRQQTDNTIYKIRDPTTKKFTIRLRKLKTVLKNTIKNYIHSLKSILTRKWRHYLNL